MEKAAVVSDASPLISISCAGGLSWLHQLFDEVLLTPAVANEILVPGKPGVDQISAAIGAGWLRVLESAPPALPALDQYDLDLGEQSAIAAAYVLKPKCLLIVDELKARMAAKKFEIPFIGTAGLLVVAKEALLISSCAAELEKLVRNGFFISSNLAEAVLKQAGETLENRPQLANLLSRRA